MSWRGFHARCPGCRRAPQGTVQPCTGCGEAFDPFATRARCPACRRPHARVVCPECGASRPWSAWLEVRPNRLDLALVLVAVLLAAIAWGSQGIVCALNDQAHVTMTELRHRPVDPWGRPLVRAWPIFAVGFGPGTRTIYSTGPNRVDEKGGGDDLIPWGPYSWQRIALLLAPTISVGAWLALLLTVLVGRRVLPARSLVTEGAIVLAGSAPLGLFAYWTCRTQEQWLLDAARALGVRTGVDGAIATALAGVVLLSAALRRAHLAPRGAE